MITKMPTKKIEFGEQDENFVKKLAQDIGCYYCKANQRTYSLNKYKSKIQGKMGVFAWVHKEDDDYLIPREQLLNDSKYEEIEKLIPELKKTFSSSFMTSLHKNANKEQKWPLLNLVRQILNVYKFKMEPIRKSDGYTLEGIKKFKRFFQIKKLI